MGDVEDNLSSSGLCFSGLLRLTESCVMGELINTVFSMCSCQ